MKECGNMQEVNLCAYIAKKKKGSRNERKKERK